jgi:hypothetical protein
VRGGGGRVSRQSVLKTRSISIMRAPSAARRSRAIFVAKFRVYTIVEVCFGVVRV